MKEKNPIDLLLAQIADMIQKIQNHKESIAENISPRVLEELERLESAIAIFDEANQKSFEEANINLDALRLEASRSSAMNEKDKQLLQRARDIEKDAKKLEFAFSQMIQNGKKTKTQSTDRLKDQIKERRKKFKRLGENKNWIPL
ncbi:MAG: hypothetical protein LW832_07370 [Parachlamydia sp.]|jgi:hypothetical protein|nr:hypothetical protein [Parachlamydia sp.]